AGLQVDWILELFGSRLVWSGKACGVRDEIDLHVAFGGNVASFRVISEIVAVNLVKARGVAAVKHDVDVVQFGATIKFELLQVTGLDGEQRALPVGFGKLKSVGGLLDLIPELLGNIL